MQAKKSTIDSEVDKMNVLSLFDGISCGMVALERAGIPVDRYIAYEIDKYAIQTSSKNYPDIIRRGNVFEGGFSDYRGVDLLIGGSPCTYWSIAKRDRETDCGGEGFKLFMQYVRALNETGAQYFLYENNYSIHQNIKDEISRRLGVQPIMINSALVSAQQRKRCYWTNIPNVTQPEDKGILLKYIIDNAVPWQGKSYCLTANYSGAYLKNTLERHLRTMVAVPIRIGDIGSNAQAHRVYSVHGKSISLSSNSGGQGGGTGLYKIDLPDGDYIIRKLSPVECERLQTLPDNYTAGVSDRQRYRQLGNGWTVDVIAHILGGLL